MTRSLEAVRPSRSLTTPSGCRPRARLRALLPPTAVILAALAVSAPTIRFDFVLYDDDYLVYNNPVIRDLKNVPLFFDPGADRTWLGSEYLPITTLSFALDYALYGLDSHGFHATNVAIYTLCCWLLYLILTRFTSHAWAAAAGAILFAVHPLHTENFAWVAGRKSLLNGVFTLVSFLAYMEFRRRDNDRRWYAVSLASYVSAFLAKYTAVSLPGALLAYDFLFPRAGHEAWSRERFSATLRSVSWTILPFLVVGGGLSILAVNIGIRHEIVSSGGDALWSSAINDPIILLHYLKVLCVPVDQCAYYLWPLRASLTFPAVVGYVVVAALLAAAWLLRRKEPLPSFAVLWFFALLVPVLNFFPKVPEMADRYLFQSSIALSFVAVWAWDSTRTRFSGCPRTRRVALLGLGGAFFLALVVVLGVASHARSSIWRDSFSLWERTLEHPMASPTAYDQLGLAHLTLARNPEASVEVFERGLEDLERRGGPVSRLAVEMRFHLVLGHLECRRVDRARRVWRELESLRAASGNPSLEKLVESWRRDLANHYPDLLRSDEAVESATNGPVRN